MGSRRVSLVLCDLDWLRIQKWKVRLARGPHSPYRLQVSSGKGVQKKKGKNAPSFLLPAKFETNKSHPSDVALTCV